MLCSSAAAPSAIEPKPTKVVMKREEKVDVDEDDDEDEFKSDVIFEKYAKQRFEATKPSRGEDELLRFIDTVLRKVWEDILLLCYRHSCNMIII